MKAPGTPTSRNLPVEGKVTEASGLPSQTEAGGAGSLEPAVIAITVVVIVVCVGKQGCG